jgi:thiosulfate dehydrogenase [quinone] large subunit
MFRTGGIFRASMTAAGNAVGTGCSCRAIGLGHLLILGMGMRIRPTVMILPAPLGANVPPIYNPIIDEHIIYIALLWILYKLKAGRYFGLGEGWSETSLVRRARWLE